MQAKLRQRNGGHERQRIPEGVEGNVDIGEGAEASGVEVLSLSSDDEGHLELEDEDNVEAVRSLKRLQEKRPRVKEDSGG